jgi:hypothetical protein
MCNNKVSLFHFRYLPIATLSLDFFMTHYPNRSSSGQLVVWPAQVLETYVRKGKGEK